MFFSLNVVDSLVILFLAIYLWFTYKRGFLGGLLELIGFTLSLLWALVFFPFVSALLQKFFIPEGLANTISFLGIWIGTELFILRLNQNIFKTLSMSLILSKKNRYTGFLPNLLSGLLIVAFVGTLLVVLPTNSMIKAQVTQSQIVGRIVAFTSVFNPTIELAFSKSVRDSLVFLTNDPSNKSKFVKLNFPSDIGTEIDSDSEEKLLTLLNLERVKRGLEPLKPNTTLTEIARDHSTDMFKRSYFGHLDPDGNDPLSRVAKTELRYESLAENLSYAPDALTSHESLLASDQHREAMLSVKYTRVGIGVVDAKNYGKMVTQFFAD